jgi:hypothetical protein
MIFVSMIISDIVLKYSSNAFVYLEHQSNAGLVSISLRRTVISILKVFSFFFALLRFEIRVLHLLDKHSTTWITPLALLLYFIFQMGSPFFPTAVHEL